MHDNVCLTPGPVSVVGIPLYREAFGAQLTGSQRDQPISVESIQGGERRKASVDQSSLDVHRH